MHRSNGDHVTAVCLRDTLDRTAAVGGHMSMNIQQCSQHVFDDHCRATIIFVRRNRPSGISDNRIF